MGPCGLCSAAAACRDRAMSDFPANNPLNQDISHAPVDPNSAKYIASLGAGGFLHPDFGTNPGYGIPYTIVGPHSKGADQVHCLR